MVCELEDIIIRVSAAKRMSIGGARGTRDLVQNRANLTLSQAGLPRPTKIGLFANNLPHTPY